jgi:hypothetical protein
MYERDMEEEGKNKKRKGWGIEIKNVIIWNCYFLCLFRYNCNQKSESP